MTEKTVVYFLELIFKMLAEAMTSFRLHQEQNGWQSFNQNTQQAPKFPASGTQNFQQTPQNGNIPFQPIGFPNNQTGFSTNGNIQWGVSGSQQNGSINQQSAPFAPPSWAVPQNPAINLYCADNIVKLNAGEKKEIRGSYSMLRVERNNGNTCTIDFAIATSQPYDISAGILYIDACNLFGCRCNPNEAYNKVDADAVKNEFVKRQTEICGKTPKKISIGRKDSCIHITLKF